MSLNKDVFTAAVFQSFHEQNRLNQLFRRQFWHIVKHLKETCCCDVRLVTQHCEPNDADVTPPSIRKVVHQALVCPSVGQLGVVDEDGGTCAWHGGHKAHTTLEMVGEGEYLAILVNYHLC